MATRTRRHLPTEERLERAKAKLSEEAKRIRRLENIIAAKKLRNAIDKRSPTAAAIRALKAVIKARTAFGTNLDDSQIALIDAIDDAVAILNAAIRKGWSVDIAAAYVTHRPPNQDPEPQPTSEDPDFEVKEPVAHEGSEL